MEALKTSIFSFNIVNLVNKGVLHFLITNSLSTDCSTKEIIHRFFGKAFLKKITKLIDASIFSFVNLKLSQERYF